MSKWDKPARIAGVIVVSISPDQWQWTLSGGVTWTFELWGHRLLCENELVAERCGSLPRAVTLSQGYEMGVADMIRKKNLEAKELSREAKRRNGIIQFPGLDKEPVE